MPNSNPTDDAEIRIHALEAELEAARSNNYILQEAGTRVVWNNEHLRASMTRAAAALTGEGADPEAIAADLRSAMERTLAK